MSVIQFRRKKIKADSDLNNLLKMAVNLRQGVETKKEVISDFPKHVLGVVMDIMIGNEMVEAESIICGIYVSNLLGSLLKSVPKHWVATDYVIKGQENNDPLGAQRGANICFLICSLFKANLGRCMKLSDYRSIGIGLYLHFYYQTGKEVGYYMSKQFNEMAEVAEECVKKI